jgi:hypothetical protein
MKNSLLHTCLSSFCFFMLLFQSCEMEEFKFFPDYDPGITINFNTPGNEAIVQLTAGVFDYTIQGIALSDTGIREFAIYNANVRTGAESGSPLENTQKTFSIVDAPRELPFEHRITGLDGDRAIRIIAVDGRGDTYKRTILVKVTPELVFTDIQRVETSDYYYGPFFAWWYGGRTYKQREVEQWADNVDISMGLVDDKPHFISPANRPDVGLQSYAGAKATKFMEVPMSLAVYNAITVIDKSPVTAFSPSNNWAEVKANTAYSFENANGAKGIIFVHALTSTLNFLDTTERVWTARISVKVEVR